MTLDWHTIKTQAQQFAATYANAKSEKAEAQSFWNDFFQIFGIERRRVAVFENTVAKLNNKTTGFMDLFWPGVLLIEHKSAGQDLALAHVQAQDYFLKLKEGEHPRYILTCDFQNFWLKDLDDGTEQRFALKDLPSKVNLFSFMRGQKAARVHAQDPINDKAVKKLSKLHDALRLDGYKGHDLQLLLVRLLFCLFADKTGLFEPQGKFADLIESRSREDGSDVGDLLNRLFSELDTDFQGRQKSTPGWFRDFPYVNGKLFEQKIRPPAFNADMRTLLLDCCYTDWSRISPAIFGSMFQHVMDLDSKSNAKNNVAKDLRRELGAHYTSEENIHKLIGPLFLDELKAEFSKAKSSANALFEFQKKLRQLHFLDPACGCGNFLVITYRELRQLELEVIKAAQGFGGRIAEPFKALMVNVDQFSGIEVEDFPASVAQVAMWLVDHQMNMLAGELLNQWMPRLPLRQSANIRVGNALAIDWAQFCPPASTHFIMGNPPFIGAAYQNDAQKKDMLRVTAAAAIELGGNLDFVAAWYIKAAQYLNQSGIASADERRKEYKDAAFAGAKQSSILDELSPAELAKKKSADEIFELAEAQSLAEREKIKIAFVSTNSICQGEQVGLLWSWMAQQGMAIEFAHRTFTWTNEAAGIAAVHCVIVGFGMKTRVNALKNKRLFDYFDEDGQFDPSGAPREMKASQINPYLVDAPTITLGRRAAPLCTVPQMLKGSQATDGGNLLLSDEEKQLLLAKEPLAAAFIRPFLGADEFINNIPRWCLWLKDASPQSWAELKLVKKRVQAVKAMRLASSSAATQRIAQTPAVFGSVRQPAQGDYILIPRHSSENRQYVPIGFASADVICGDANSLIPGADLYHFGVLTSMMHMAWMKYTCGRIKSDYRYSNTIVYNNYPWPDLSNAAKDQTLRTAVETAAQAVLDARAVHQNGEGSAPPASLAVLYDPLTMPTNLRAAHQALDKAVDAAYGKKGLKTDAQRVAFLFERYEALVSMADAQAKPAAAATQEAKASKPPRMNADAAS